MKVLRNNPKVINKIVWDKTKEQSFPCCIGSDEIQEVNEILDLDSDVLNQPISEAEVRAAVSKLKTGKACDLDNILAEMLKIGGSKISVFLVTYFNNLFDKGVYPQDWAKTIIVPIHKKGNADLPDNYRGVSLLSIISNCYTSILNKQLYVW